VTAVDASIRPTIAGVEAELGKVDEPAASAQRVKLPNRRRVVRHRITIGNQIYDVDIGLSPLGRPMEVFIAGPSAGSDLAAIAHDIATVISLALQHGLPPEVLAKSIARLPGQPTEALELGLVGDPATIIGVVLDLLTRSAAEPALI
jgi:ribonucleoside-diphosphate reductase alpha chain